jgi:hypothetical protein
MDLYPVFDWVRATVRSFGAALTCGQPRAEPEPTEDWVSWETDMRRLRREARARQLADAGVAERARQALAAANKEMAAELDKTARSLRFLQAEVGHLKKTCRVWEEIACARLVRIRELDEEGAKMRKELEDFQDQLRESGDYVRVLEEERAGLNAMLDGEEARLGGYRVSVGRLEDREYDEVDVGGAEGGDAGAEEHEQGEDGDETVNYLSAEE